MNIFDQLNNILYRRIRNAIQKPKTTLKDLR